MLATIFIANKLLLLQTSWDKLSGNEDGPGRLVMHVNQLQLSY